MSMRYHICRHEIQVKDMMPFQKDSMNLITIISKKNHQIREACKSIEILSAYHFSHLYTGSRIFDVNLNIS